MLPEDEYLRHDAVALAALVRAGEIRAVDLLDCALARAERLGPVLNPIAHRLDAMAGAQLDTLPAGGVLSGVPFLVKDTGAGVAGAPMTSGSRLYAGNVTPADSTLVSRYRAAGLVIIGKSNTPELGLSFTTEPVAQGPSRNPWDLARSPGGSSGGAAAAVAAGIVPVAHASDGAGSIRVPASHCGLFGFKPSRMRTPMGPDLGEALAGMSSPHCISRTVRDSAVLLDASAGPEPGDPYAVPPSPLSFQAEAARDPARLRIGLATRSPLGSPVDPECAAAAERAARLCSSLGHIVEEAAIDHDAVAVKRAWRVIVSVIAAQHVQARAAAHPQLDPARLLEPVNAAWMAQAARLTAFDYAAAVNDIRSAGRAAGRSFTRYDLFLTPCAAASAPLLGTLAGTDDDVDAFYDRFWSHGPFTAVYNATGCPAMSIPMGFTASGLPVGAHFGAALGQDGLLFALAGQIERAAPWSLETPFARMSAVGIT